MIAPARQAWACPPSACVSRDCFASDPWPCGIPFSGFLRRSGPGRSAAPSRACGDLPVRQAQSTSRRRADAARGRVAERWMRPAPRRRSPWRGTRRPWPGLFGSCQRAQRCRSRRTGSRGREPFDGVAHVVLEAASHRERSTAKLAARFRWRLQQMGTNVANSQRARSGHRPPPADAGWEMAGKTSRGARIASRFSRAPGLWVSVAAFERLFGRIT